MTPEEQQRTETLLSLFEHEGWKIAIQELTELNEYLRQYADTSCIDNDSWQYRRGQLQAQDSFLSFEVTTRMVADLEEQEEVDNVSDV